MRYFEFRTVKEVETGKDALGNPVVEFVDSDLCTGRVTEWTADDIEINGREFTAGNRKVLTNIPYEALRDAVSVVIDEGTYEITGKKRLSDRWRMLYIKGLRL